MEQKNNQLALRQNDPRQALAKYDPEQYNILMPKISLEYIPAGLMISAREVQLDPKPSSKTHRGDVYSQDSGLALHGHALDKIANTAGITWVEIARIDDRSHPHYCEFKAVARVTDFDGTIRDFVGTKTLDLRATAGEGFQGKDVAGMSTAQLGKQRQFITELCAAKAKNRAIRGIMNLKQGYTREEIERPFIVPKLVPDPNNAMAQRMMLAQMTGATQALYPAQQPEVIEAESISISEAVHPDPAAPDQNGVGGGDFPLSSPPQNPPDFSEKVKMIWAHAKEHGVTGLQFKNLCLQATDGKADPATFTADDVERIEQDLESMIAVPADDDYPFGG